MKLFSNSDPSMKMVREFEERSAALGYQSLITEAMRYTGELGMTLKPAYPKPTVCEVVGKEVIATKAKQLLRSKYEEQLLKTVCDEAWQENLHTARWNDDSVSTENCFSWLRERTSCPTYVVAGVYELYEQLLPTKLYQVKKIKISQPKPKPEYVSEDVQALWDTATYGANYELQANRIDAKIVNHKSKEVVVLEMSWPWIENREKKDEGKSVKYGPLQWELQERYPGYTVQQYNIIIDMLGGWSRTIEGGLRRLLGKKTKDVLRNLQKSVMSSTLNIARMFKIMT